MISVVSESRETRDLQGERASVVTLVSNSYTFEIPAGISRALARRANHAEVQAPPSHESVYDEYI